MNTQSKKAKPEIQHGPTDHVQQAYAIIAIVKGTVEKIGNDLKKTYKEYLKNVNGLFQQLIQQLRFLTESNNTSLTHKNLTQTFWLL